jgi:hypothetical protein
MLNCALRPERVSLLFEVPEVYPKETEATRKSGPGI